MRKAQKLFRTKVFGGYHKADVDRYVRRLGEELKECSREVEQHMEVNEKNRTLIEEAIREIRALREENERLRGRQERYQRQR